MSDERDIRDCNPAALADAMIRHAQAAASAICEEVAREQRQAHALVLREIEACRAGARTGDRGLS